MALTITKQPDWIALTGNEMIFGLHSDNAFEVAGVAFEGYLMASSDFFSSATTQITMTFTWGTNSFGVLKVENGAAQYVINSGALSEQRTVLEKLMAKLNENFEFSRDFYAVVNYVSGYYSYYRLVITAREKGSVYLLDCDASEGWYPTAGTGTDATLRSNFRVGWQAQIYNAALAQYEDIGEAQLESPDENGNVNIDVSEFLQRDATGHFSWPEIYDNNLSVHAILDRYRIKYFEYYGATPQYHTVKYSSWAYCLQGRVSQLRLASLLQFGLTFYTYLYNSQKFLTFAPREKLVSTKQRELLYFYVRKPISVIRLMAKASYTDGTTSADTLVASKIDHVSHNKDLVLEIFAGYSASTLADLDPLKTIAKYQIWLTDSAYTPISEVRTYIVDQRYSEFERYFMYRNKIGVYEMLRATGQAYANLKTEKGFIKTPLPADYDITERSLKQASVEKTVVFTQNSGLIEDISTINYISEFLESSDVYYCDNKFAYPVTIYDGSFRLFEDALGVYSFEFDYEFAVEADSTEEFLIATTRGSFNDSFNKSFF